MALLLLGVYMLPSGKSQTFAWRGDPSTAAKPASATEMTKGLAPVLDDIDILEAFDELDSNRQGFVHCAAVRAHLGSSETESEVIRAVAVSIPSFGVIFYADFVRLAQRPGPLATVLAERASQRQRLAAARLTT